MRKKDHEHIWSRKMTPTKCSAEIVLTSTSKEAGQSRKPRRSRNRKNRKRINRLGRNKRQRRYRRFKNRTSWEEPRFDRNIHPQDKNKNTRGETTKAIRI